MTCFAKEVGLVGRDSVDQLDQFLFPAFGRKKIGAVGRAGGILETVPAPAEPDLQHRLLVGPQVDAGLFVDQVTKPVEIGRGEILDGRAQAITSAERTADRISVGKTRSMSRIMMNCASRLPMPLMKSVRIWVPILGAGWI